MIRWHDSGVTHESGWVTPAQVPNVTPIVESVGYIVHEDEENITIAQGRSFDPELMYLMHTIWKPAITHIVDLYSFVSDQEEVSG